MSEFDLVIRSGSVVDGTGSPPRTADVAVRGGAVAEVGRVSGRGRREVDADGALVTPGFVDVHTHYDGQVTWDEQLLPSSWHGVTTVVMGNCGVGFAPVRPHDRDRLVELVEGVEDIPGAALHEGLPWAWETFPEYLDYIDRPHDIDVAAQVPHGAVRLYAMGERGADRDPASPDDIAAMGDIVREAVAAGALGFTTSRTLNHRTSRGEPTPTLGAAEAELVGIAEAMSHAGGVLEVVSDFADLGAEFGTLRRMVERSGRPLSISVVQVDGRPDGWRELLGAIEAAAGAGLDITAQVAPRPIGLVLGLQATLNPFVGLPSYRQVADLPLAERVVALADPERRARILAESAGDGERRPRLVGRLERTFELGDPPEYEPDAADSIASRAARAGRSPEELAYDLLLGDGGRALLYFPLFNYSDGNLDAVREMLLHERAVVGLADGGAHVGTICDASFPTTLLALWGRGRRRGEGIPLPWLVRRQTRDTARLVGLLDRGVLAPGYKADVNVIDLDRLAPGAPTMAFDLPAGGKRLLQQATGYRHTFVSGVEVYDGGEHTGALPGRLVRGPQRAAAEVRP